MAQRWWHVKSIGMSVDLDQISAISWNVSKTFQNDLFSETETTNRICTLVILGTSVTGNSTATGVFRNTLWICDDTDRQELHKGYFPDIPIEIQLNHK